MYKKSTTITYIIDSVTWLNTTQATGTMCIQRHSAPAASAVVPATVAVLSLMLLLLSLLLKHKLVLPLQVGLVSTVHAVVVLGTVHPHVMPAYSHWVDAYLFRVHVHVLLVGLVVRVEIAVPVRLAPSESICPHEIPRVQPSSTCSVNGVDLAATAVDVEKYLNRGR